MEGDATVILESLRGHESVMETLASLTEARSGRG
jgi:hypothetical protein